MPCAIVRVTVDDSNLTYRGDFTGVDDAYAYLNVPDASIAYRRIMQEPSGLKTGEYHWLWRDESGNGRRLGDTAFTPYVPS